MLRFVAAPFNMLINPWNFCKKYQLAYGNMSISDLVFETVAAAETWTAGKCTLPQNRKQLWCTLHNHMLKDEQLWYSGLKTWAAVMHTFRMSSCDTQQLQHEQLWYTAIETWGAVIHGSCNMSSCDTHPFWT
jgi:hypothetical protein